MLALQYQRQLCVSSESEAKMSVGTNVVYPMQRAGNSSHFPPSFPIFVGLSTADHSICLSIARLPRALIASHLYISVLSIFSFPLSPAGLYVRVLEVKKEYGIVQTVCAVLDEVKVRPFPCSHCHLGSSLD